MSGRQEAAEFLEHCRRNPEKVVAISQLAGAINEAAFLQHMVQQYGAGAAIDQITRDPYRWFRDWDKWSKEDPEGKAWFERGVRALKIEPEHGSVRAASGDTSR
jgi:hypothetical protein